MKIKKIIAATALAGALCSVGIAANATTQYPNEGGTWNYGLSVGVHQYSDYLVNRCHGTTVINDWGTVKSVDTIKDQWARASQKATSFTHNKYYYRVC